MLTAVDEELARLATDGLPRTSSPRAGPPGAQLLRDVDPSWAAPWRRRRELNHGRAELLLTSCPPGSPR